MIKEVTECIETFVELNGDEHRKQFHTLDGDIASFIIDTLEREEYPQSFFINSRDVCFIPSLCSFFDLSLVKFSLCTITEDSLLNLAVNLEVNYIPDEALSNAIREIASTCFGFSLHKDDFVFSCAVNLGTIGGSDRIIAAAVTRDGQLFCMCPSDCFIDTATTCCFLKQCIYKVTNQYFSRYTVKKLLGYANNHICHRVLSELSSSPPSSATLIIIQNPVYLSMEERNKTVDNGSLSCFDSASDSGKLHLFVLAGQSNMSGRGTRDDFTTYYKNSGLFSFIDFHSSEDYLLSEKYKSRVCQCDIVDGWRVMDPWCMHKKVDVLKSCGLGPGVSFACRVLNELLVTEKDPYIGLIPAAVGSTFLREWRASYPVNEADCTSGNIITPPNASYAATNGFCNLQSAVMRSIHVAIRLLEKFRGSVSLDALLWYQGENDCSDLGMSSAENYAASFSEFVSEMRANLSVLVEVLKDSCVVLDPLPVITTAITSTRPWLSRLKDVRSQQLSSDIVRLNAVSVVNAFGLPLKPDGIHLTAPSSYIIGLELANAALRFGRRCSFENYNSRTVQSAQNPNRSDFELSSEIELSSWATQFELSRARAQSEANYDLPSKLSFLLSSVKSAGNLIYGEVGFTDLCKFFLSAIKCRSVLNKDHRTLDKPFSLNFLSLGCGSGPCLAAALSISLSERNVLLKHIRGIELLDSKIIECNLLTNDILASTHSSRADTIILEVLGGNFFDYDWNEYDLIYTCATCYSSDQCRDLIRRLCALKMGTRFLIIDLHHFTQAAGESATLFFHNYYALLTSSEALSSWGTCSCFVCEKIL